MIFSRSANFYTQRTRQQLLAEEPDHSPFTAEQVQYIEKELSRWGGSTLADQPLALSVNDLQLPDAQVGSPYDVALKTSGGYSGVTYKLETHDVNRDDFDNEYAFLVAQRGGLALGLELTALGHIAGVPAVSGAFSFTVIVTDQMGSVGKKQLSLSVKADPSLSQEEQDALTVNTPPAKAAVNTQPLAPPSPKPVVNAPVVEP